MAYTLIEKVQENIYCKNIQLPHEEQNNILNSRKKLVANCIMEKNHKNCHKKSKLPKTYMKNIGISFVK
jgi:hypothetical protein